MLVLDREQELQKMKQMQVEMLSAVHDICVQNGLRYYMIGGTMLGAIRHKGFIPWDDDIDIALPRKDYEAFIKLAQKALPQQMSILEDRITENYQYKFAKVINNRTRLHEHSVKEEFVIGVYIDVFPLDGLPDNPGEQKRHVSRILHHIKMLNRCVSNMETKRVFYKKILVAIIQKCCSYQKQLEKIKNLLLQYDFDHATIGGNLVGMWGEKEIMPISYFGEPKLYEFEGHQFFGVEHPDVYLTKLYGDYMQLPPKEKQVSHHNYTLEFLED